MKTLNVSIAPLGLLTLFNQADKQGIPYVLVRSHDPKNPRLDAEERSMVLEVDSPDWEGPKPTIHIYPDGTWLCQIAFNIKGP